MVGTMAWGIFNNSSDKIMHDYAWVLATITHVEVK